MSACDGSGRAIGCPGCSECWAEMAEIDATIAELTGRMQQLRHRRPSSRRPASSRPAPSAAEPRPHRPWPQTFVEEPAW